MQQPLVGGGASSNPIAQSSPAVSNKPWSAAAKSLKQNWRLAPPTTLSNVNYAVTTWAQDQTQDVVLYLVGNGDDGVFELNATEDLR